MRLMGWCLLVLIVAGCSETEPTVAIDPWQRRGMSSLEFDPYGSSRQPAEVELFKYDQVVEPYTGLHINEDPE